MPPGAYTKPPIVEAIVEFRLQGALSQKDLAKLGDLFARSHPTLEKRVSVEAEIKLGEARVKSTEDGTFVRRSSDATEAVIVTRYGIGFACMPPYIGWEAFRDRCMERWSKVVGLLGRRALSRLGVRFQNRIDVPGSDSPMELVLRAQPGPVGEFGGVAMWVKQTVLLTLPGGMKANLSTGPIDGALIDHASFVIDVDVFDDAWTAARDDAIVARLNELRSMKNAIFEAYITDYARTIFDSD